MRGESTWFVFYSVSIDTHHLHHPLPALAKGDTKECPLDFGFRLRQTHHKDNDT
jgi:hypothetical protein